MNTKTVITNSVKLCIGILLFRFFFEPVLNLGSTPYFEGVKISIQSVMNPQSIIILLVVSTLGGLYISWRQVRKIKNR